MPKGDGLGAELPNGDDDEVAFGWFVALDDEKGEDPAFSPAFPKPED